MLLFHPSVEACSYEVADLRAPSQAWESGVRWASPGSGIAEESG